MREVPAPGCFGPGPRFAARSGVPRGRSPLGCVPEGGGERSLDELGKRPTSVSSAERKSRTFAYSSQYVTSVCMFYTFLCSDMPRKRCTRYFARLICALVDNPRRRRRALGACPCAACPPHFALRPFPALSPEAGPLDHHL